MILEGQEWNEDKNIPFNVEVDIKFLYFNGTATITRNDRRPTKLYSVKEKEVGVYYRIDDVQCWRLK